MITPMTKYSFILLNEDTEKFMSRLQELGVVDITRSTKPVDETSRGLLSTSDNLKKAIALLEETDYSKDPDWDKISSIVFSSPEDHVSETFQARDELNSLAASLDKAQKERSELLPWGEFDASAIEGLAREGFKTRWYKVSKKAFKSEWAEKYPLSVINDNGNDIYFVTISDAADYSLPVPETAAPSESYLAKDKEIADIEARIISAKGKLNCLKSHVDEMKAEYNASVVSLDKYLAEASSKKAAEDKIATFVGFAPTSDDAALEKEFSSMDIFYLKETAVTGDNPPIKLKNNWFVRMFEPLTDMYGRPVYDEFDPTPFISIFFMLFFAFCMGDMGYGLLFIIGGLLLKKVDSFRSYSPLVVTLGIATTVVGFIFHTFFSMDIEGWKCIPDFMKKVMLPSKIAGYDGTMVLSIIMGIIHLSLAFIVKAVYATKRNGFAESLGTWGWTLLIVGGAIVGGVYLTGALNSEVTKWVIIVLGCISAIGIFILNDIHRNPLINIGSGIWDTYNTATGLLSDVLSYLRLYALGLAGSMLGSAFNTIGLMILGDKTGVFNWLFFIILVVLGHTLNIAMSALGAFVHPLRLNFLEFFKNSGYEGTGRSFKPLTKTVEEN